RKRRPHGGCRGRSQCTLARRKSAVSQRLPGPRVNRVHPIVDHPPSVHLHVPPVPLSMWGLVPLFTSWTRLPPPELRVVITFGENNDGPGVANRADITLVRECAAEALRRHRASRPFPDRGADRSRAR